MPKATESPDKVLEALRERIAMGGRPLLDDLVGEQMAAASKLILEGKAQVITSGCYLYLTATLKD